MKRLPWAVRAAAILSAALGLWLLLVLGMVSSTLEGAARAEWLGAIEGHWPLLLMGWLFASLGVYSFARAVERRFVRMPARLAERVRSLVADERAQGIEPQRGGDDAPLVEAINALAAQRQALRAEVEARVAEGSRRVEAERNRLAALVGELPQAVVVCNVDGRIVLYNRRARLQFRALSEHGDLTEGKDLLGIGRSIYAVFERALIAHALDRIQTRLERGARLPTAQFVTVTRAGQLLRVLVTPVLAAESVDGVEDGADGEKGAAELRGFVLILENVTRQYAEAAEREAAVLALGLKVGPVLGELRAAVAGLDEPASQSRLRESLRTLEQSIQTWTQESARLVQQRWPLEDVLAGDFFRAVAARISAATGRAPSIELPDEALWMRLDSFSMIQALAYLAQRLVDEYDVRYLRLRAMAAGPVVHVDLVWTGQALNNETAMSWGFDPFGPGAPASALTVREVVDRHAAQWWFERDRVRNEGFFRFVLARVQDVHASVEATEAPLQSRPEFFDFDLFAHREVDEALLDRPLSSLTYCVFDTETTGLNPSAGDAIIQIGAVRVVNGRVLRQESFEQLVDPGRPIPAASIPIHGITPEMVAGKPRIENVLPAFHRFATDAVLVAHNAAFDMKFLQLLEPRTGLRFDHPVLDTLLLSTLVHPNEESHRLEALAERFHIPVVGRHTALGDALVTAEVWVRLLPLLQAQGIHTLGQALEASRKTYYARLKY
ncbi:DNA polymerase-3 subunit epsilon [Tibeticola sediminis]|uniref:DNA-directed DNA polymerase n=1 Tax=Tibeticola sediminis TaxID=1917811 RepID=A0A3N4US50_9BURK|nr:3'-5' exonuclease [Tibeticola sediminis]RPE67777.1 DNA polymerase-3 subunit epsilon [Tibeticola sediminis]